ncbi:hypothetical protein JCM3775_005546 [Rhodotorula graminis]
MAPLKLPKKGKGKQVHIDFASLDSARTSAPSSWTADDWFDEGTRQEEQGERYQAGPKATRHCNNACVCYALAALANPLDFDSRYNGARVLQTLATEHLGPAECLAALDKARSGYRDALAVLDLQQQQQRQRQPGDGDGDSSATARIDALFNLAQADVALFDALDDAVTAVEGERERAVEAASEAKRLFVEVERLQRDEMARFFGAGVPGAAASGNDEDEDEAIDEVPSSGPGGGAETSVRAMESTIVTPQLVIDTLLESLRFDLALHDWAHTDDATQAELRSSALAAFERATELRAAVQGDAAELDFELAFARASMLTTLSPTEATPVLDELARAHPRKVDLLSLGADHLVESLPLSPSPSSSPSPSLPTLLSTLSTALAAYESARALLSNRLSPPRDLPAAHLPSLLSANLVAQSSVHLVAYELLSRAAAPSAAAPADAAQQQAAAHLVQAHALALEATGACRSGLSLAVSTSAPSPSPSSSSAKPALALVRAPASTDPRTDTRTVLALRRALFALSRVRVRLDAAGLEGERAQFWALWRALGLGAARGVGGGAGEKGSEGERRVRERDARWWSDEVEGDKVMEAMGDEAASAERAYWQSLLEA